MTIRFTIPGPPQGKQRARSGNGHHYTPEKTRAYEAEIATIAKAARGKAGVSEPWDVAIGLNVTAYMPIPKSWSKAKQSEYEGFTATCKPDWDNIGKIVCDALNGILYVDDKQVAAASVTKRYSVDPRVLVEVST